MSRASSLTSACRNASRASVNKCGTTPVRHTYRHDSMLYPLSPVLSDGGREDAQRRPAGYFPRLRTAEDGVDHGRDAVTLAHLTLDQGDQTRRRCVLVGSCRDHLDGAPFVFDREECFPLRSYHQSGEADALAFALTECPAIGQSGRDNRPDQGHQRGPGQEPQQFPLIAPLAGQRVSTPQTVQGPWLEIVATLPPGREPAVLDGLGFTQECRPRRAREVEAPDADQKGSILQRGRADTSAEVREALVGASSLALLHRGLGGPPVQGADCGKSPTDSGNLL